MFRVLKSDANMVANSTISGDFESLFTDDKGHMVVQLVEHCATSQKVEGSIPDGITGIFHSNNPSDRTMALG
jgi:hypothetical protein